MVCYWRYQLRLTRINNTLRWMPAAESISICELKGEIGNQLPVETAMACVAYGLLGVSYTAATIGSFMLCYHYFGMH